MFFFVNSYKTLRTCILFFQAHSGKRKTNHAASPLPMNVFRKTTRRFKKTRCGVSLPRRVRSGRSHRCVHSRKSRVYCILPLSLALPLSIHIHKNFGQEKTIRYYRPACWYRFLYVDLERRCLSTDVYIHLLSLSPSLPIYR